MIQVDPSNDIDVGIIERRGAEDAGVRANVGTLPGGGDVFGVGINSDLPSLEGNVGLLQPLIGEGIGNVDLELEIGGELVVFFEMK